MECGANAARPTSCEGKILGKPIAEGAQTLTAREIL